MDQERLGQFYQSKVWRSEQHPYLIKQLLSRSGLQRTYTPVELCTEIIGKLSEYTNLANSQILVLFNLEFVDTLIRVFRVNPANITYFADSEFEARAARKWYKVECPNELITWDTDKKRIIMPNIKKQFDVVVMNPPYQANLHAKFLKIATKLSSTVVSVQPANWLTVDEEEDGLQDFVDVKKEITNCKKSVDLINGNFFFDASFYMPCSVLHLQQNIKDKNLHVKMLDGRKVVFGSVFDYNKFGDLDFYPTIVDKIAKFSEKSNLFQTLENKDQSKNWYVNLARVRGNTKKKSPTVLFDSDFYTLLPRDYTPEKTTDKFYSFGFDTLEQSQNFIDFLKTKIARFAFAINKHGSSIRRKQLSTIPYLNFNRRYTDKILCDLFKITDAEFEFIDRVIDNYY